MIKITRQKNVISATALGLSLIKNPRNLKNVVRFSDLMMDIIPENERNKYINVIRQTDVARQAFENRLQISPWDWDHIAGGDDNSLGKHFVNFLLDNNIHPDKLPMPDISDDFSYAIAYLTETHDIMHVLMGYGTDLDSELGLIAFFSAQIASPFYLMLISGSLLNAAFYERGRMNSRMAQISQGWRMGNKADKLFGINWNDYWHTDIDEVRRKFNIEIASLKTRSQPL